jgi:hypothetical protein
MGSDDIAVLRDGETTYMAQSRPDCLPSDSAPLVLIQAIYDLKPMDARRIARHRIWTTVKASPGLQGMVKVAAKRVTSELSRHHPALQIDPNQKQVDLSSRPIWRPEPVRLSESRIPPAGAGPAFCTRIAFFVAAYTPRHSVVS